MKTQRMVHSEHLEFAMTLSRSLVAVLALIAAGVAQSKAGSLHASNGFTEELLTINTSTGAGTSVGALGFIDVRSLAFDPNTNTLYGSDVSSDQLLTINTSTGAGTSVGALGFGLVAGLAFDPNTNTLYGSDVLVDELLTINTSTGAATSVGALGFGAVAGLAFDPNTNTLYGSDVSSDQLLTINTSTGAGASVGALGFDNVHGLAFDPNTNTLYGSDVFAGELLTINTSTGAGTSVGALGFTSVEGLAVVPEPSTVMLAAIGLVGLAAFGWPRRKRRRFFVFRKINPKPLGNLRGPEKVPGTFSKAHTQEIPTKATIMAKCFDLFITRKLIPLIVLIVCLFACASAGAGILVSETFDNYTGFPASANDLGGHMSNYGVPTEAEGADSGLWLGARFEEADNDPFIIDVGVLKFGSGSSGGPYGNPAGRIGDEAGLVVRLDLTNYADPVLSFDWATFETEADDRLVAAYYTGDGLGTPGGLYDWFADPALGNGDVSGSDPQGAANSWYLANWTEVHRDTSPGGFQQEAGINLTGAGGNVTYLAFWLDGGDDDLGKIDNIVIAAEPVPVPEPSSALPLGLGAVACIACRWRRRRTAIGKIRSPRCAAARRVGKLSIVLFCALAAALAGATRAEATVIAQFTGTVTSVDLELTSGFVIGESVTGSFSFDETTPDAHGSSTFGLYAETIMAYTVNYSAGYAASDTVGDIHVIPQVADPHTLNVLSSSSPTGPSVAGQTLGAIHLQLIDNSGTVFPSDALPTSLDLADFSSQVLALQFVVGGDSGFVLADIETLSVVPEPSSALLLGLGALATIVCVPRVRRSAAAGVRRGRRSAGVCTGVLLALAMLGARTGFMRFVRAGCLVALVLGWGASLSQAQLWVGATEDWGTASNWLPVFPPPGSSVTFGAAGVKSVDFGDTTRSVGNFSIASDTDYFFDNGTLQISGDFISSGLSGSHEFESNHYTAAFPMFEPSNQTLFGVNSNHTFTINDTVSFSDLGLAAGSSNVSLTKDGAGTMIVRNRLNIDGDIDIDSGVLDLRTVGGNTPASSAGAIDLNAATLLLGGTATFDSIDASSSSNLSLTDADITITGTNLAFGARGTTTITDSKLNMSNNGTFFNLGTMTISGANSDLSLRQFSTVDDGSTTISNGARVATGAFTAVGAGTSSPADSDLIVSGGATLDTGDLAIGENAGENGAVRVTGSNSRIDANFSLELGGNSQEGSGGRGTLLVQDNGVVSIDGETRFYGSSSTITANGGTFSTGTLAAEPGVTPTISITDPTSGSALVIGTNDGDTVFGGLIRDIPTVLGGPGSVRKVGAGTLTLTNAANSYTGGTYIQDGVVSIANDLVLGAAGTDIHLDGGALNATASIVSARTLEVDSDSTLNGSDMSFAKLGGSGDLDLAATDLTVGAGNQSSSFAGSFSGSGTLTKTGLGTLTLQGVGSSHGGTIIQEGVVSILFGGSGLGAPDSTVELAGGTLNIAGGAGLLSQQSLHVSAASALSGGVPQQFAALSGSGDLQLGTSLIVSVPENSASTYNGTLSGTSLFKDGAGTLTLTNAANSHGGTFVVGGVLSISDDGALGNAADSLWLQGGTLNATANLSSTRELRVTLNSGVSGSAMEFATMSGNRDLDIATPSLTVGGDHQDFAFAADLTGSGTFIKTGLGTFTHSGNSLPAKFDVEGGTLDLTASATAGEINIGTSGSFGLGRANISSGADISAGKVTLGSTNAIGQLSITDGSLTSTNLQVGGTAAGAIGIATLEGPNASIVDSSFDGFQVLRGSARFAGGATATLDYLDVGMPDTTGASVLVEGADTTIQANNRLNAGWAFGYDEGPGQFEIRDGAELTTPLVNIWPEGKFILGADAVTNTERVSVRPGGDFVWDGGTLNDTAGGLTVADRTLNFVNNGGTYNFTGDLTIPDARAFDVNDATLSAVTIDLDALGSFVALNATITTNTMLDSSGVMTLTDTTINGPVALAAGSATNVIGQVDFQDLVTGPGEFFGSGTANFNGGYAPGASPAAVPFEGSVALGTDNTLFIELAGTGLGQFDALLIDGDAMLDGMLDVSLLSYTPAGGEVFDIILADTILGDFASLNLPALGGDLFWQTETITDPLGPDAYRLTAVPEPSSVVLLGLGALACIAYLRLGRRRCSSGATKA